MSAGILSSTYGVGSASRSEVYYETRDDGLAAIAEQMAPAIHQVATWGRIDRTRADDDIASTRPSDDAAAPGYFVEVASRATLRPDGHLDIEAVARPVHRRR